MYEDPKIKVMESSDSSDAWIKNCDKNTTPFAGYVQSHSHKTTTMHMSTTIVEYPVNAKHLKVSTIKRQQFVENGSTSVGFLSI